VGRDHRPRDHDRAGRPAGRVRHLRGTTRRAPARAGTGGRR